MLYICIFSDKFDLTQAIRVSHTYKVTKYGSSKVIFISKSNNNLKHFRNVMNEISHMKEWNTTTLHILTKTVLIYKEAPQLQCMKESPKICFKIKY